MPLTVPHDFADYGLESGDSASSHWRTGSLLWHLQCLIEMQSWMTFGLGLRLDRHLSRFQEKEMLWLYFQMNQQNSAVGFYPFWGMSRCHCRKLARLDLSFYPKRMKPSRHYLN